MVHLRKSATKSVSRALLQRVAAFVFVALLPLMAVAAVQVGQPGPALRGLGVDVQPGDRLLAWRGRDGRWHDGGDALAWWRHELVLAPLGPLPVRLQRGDAVLERELPGGRWDWQLDEVGDTPRATQWRQLRAAGAHAAVGDWGAMALQCNQAARSGAADLALEYCWQLAEANPQRQAGLELARALVASRAAESDPLLQARAQLALARSAFTVRDYTVAGEAAAQALPLAGGEGAPNTIAAGALQVLGFIDYRQGRLDAAMERYTVAERRVRAIAPDGLQHAGLRGALAAVHGSRGDLDTAVAEAEQAIVAMARVAPGQMSLGRLQFNAGLMAFERGRLDVAERELGAALATFVALAPDGSEAAMSRAQLAQTLERRGESARAERLLRDAVGAGLRLDAHAYEALSMRLQLALALAGQERRSEALREVDAVAAATTGERSDTLHADALSLRAQLRLDDGAFEAALADADAAAALLRVRERNIQLAPVLVQRADALRRLRRYDDAAAAAAEALHLRRRYAPQTVLEAEALLAQARIDRDRGDAPMALSGFAAALDALEAQRDLLGGDAETRARWAARSAPFYREMLAQLLALDRIDAAWLLLERYRAREFLDALGQRRDALLAQVDAPLRDEARAIAEDYLRAQKQAQAGTAPDADRFARLRERSARLQQRLAAADPRLAGLAPRAVVASDVAAALPADTALVSYAVLPAGSWAFVLRQDRPDVQAIALDVDAATLGGDVDALRLLVTLPGAGAASETALKQRAAALHAQLIAPLQSALGDATRLYLIADGPLHRLPFAALRDAAGEDGRWLAQRYAIGLLVSAGAYVATPPGAAPGGDARIAVFAGSGSDVALPAATREADAITQRFGVRARLYRDAAATPGAALAALRDADIVHFAGHAVVDPAFPLDSYLRLGDGDARLSAWDIVRAAPLRTRLVTLAACDSALGFNAGGEGLVGLTRALQIASAGTVVATLWRIGDAPTAPLMQDFYAALARGAAPDSALAQAQRMALEVSAWRRWLGLAEDWRHPYYWSGFVVSAVR